MTRLRTWWNHVRLRLGSLGLFLLGVSALISAVTGAVDSRADARHADDLARSQECRFDVVTEVAVIESQMKEATALGLVAVAHGDDAALEQQAARIEALAAELGPANERRERGVEICDANRSAP